ncbi:MAG: hypothetical protein OEZ13_06040 [Spirochaetia bacterium]|nr:hypothetical protein [Spirochaetia bacterium]
MKPYKITATIILLIFLQSCSGVSTDDLLNGESLSQFQDTTPPNILSPADGSTIGLSAVLQWTSKAGASSYTVEVATDSAFTLPITGSPFTVNAPTTSYTLDLTTIGGNTYFWRVAADTTEAGQYGQASFNAIDNIIYVYCDAIEADCSSLSANSTAVGTKSNPYKSISYALSRASVLGIYEVRVASRDTIGTPYEEIIAIRDGINIYGGYYVDFSTRDFANPTVVSSNSSFVAFAQNIFMTTVIDGFVFINNSTSLEVTYGVKTDNCSSGLIFNDVTINGGSGNQSYGLYNINSSYVNVTNSAITTGNSSIGATGVFNDPTSAPVLTSVTVTTGTAPTTSLITNASYADTSPPNALGPADGSEVSLTPTIVWTSKSGAAEYYVEIATDSSFVSPISGSPFTVLAPATSYTADLTSYGGGTYYWRVRADTTEASQYASGYFIVLDEFIYVYCVADTTCSDEGTTGTLNNPYQTAAKGVSEAYRLGKSEVRIASRGAGIDTTYEGTVVLKEGVTIYGGYDASFSIRDPAINRTILSSNGNFVIYAADIFLTTIVDGVEIKNTAVGLTTTIAVKTDNCSNDLQFNNVLINGGSGSTAYGMYNTNYAQPYLFQSSVTTNNTSTRSIGIYNNLGSFPLLENSFITTGASGTTIGVLNEQSSSSGTVMLNSEVIPLNAQTFSAGISGNNSLPGGDVSIYNSYITSGDVTLGPAYAIYAENGTVTDSIISTGTGTIFTGIYFENPSGVESVNISNNIVTTSNTSATGSGIYLGHNNILDNFLVSNNTIGIEGNDSKGIEISADAASNQQLKIDNNIIYSKSGSETTAIKTGSAVITTMDNNINLGASSFLNYNGASYAETCSALNTQGTGTFGGWDFASLAFETKNNLNTRINGYGESYLKDIYGNGNTIILATYGSGIAVSTDGGATWSHRISPDSGLESNYIEEFWTNGSTIYAATSYGFASGSSSFTNYISGLPSTNLRSLFYNGTIYVGTSSGFAWSSNGGSSWTTRTTAEGLIYNEVYSSYVSGSNIYVGTGYGTSVSTNSGASFTINANTGNGLGGSTVYAIWGNGSTVYAGTTGGFSISTNNGASYTNKTTANGLPANNIYDMIVNGSTIYVATSGGVGVSYNGGSTFSTLYTSRTTHRIYKTGSNIYAANYDSYAYSHDNGSSWTTVYSADGLNRNIQNMYISGNTVYAATDPGGLAISTDGGNTFINKTPDNGFSSASALDVKVQEGIIYAVSWDGLYTSTDKGASFTKIYSINNIEHLEIDGNNIYLGKGYGELYVSNDGGATFNQKLSGLNNIYDLFVDHSNSTLYVATEDWVGSAVHDLYVSTDNGATFYTINFSSQINTVYAKSDNLYVGTETGLYYSADGGSSFDPKKTTSDGLMDNRVHDIAASGANLYVLTLDGLTIFVNGWIEYYQYSMSQKYDISVDGSRLFIAGGWNGLAINKPCTALFTTPTTAGNKTGTSVADLFASGFSSIDPSTWLILGSGPADLDTSGGWTPGDIGADAVNAGVSAGITPGAGW